MLSIILSFKKNKDVKVLENKRIDITIIFQEQACDIAKFSIYLYPKINNDSNLEEMFLGLCKKVNVSYQKLENYVYNGLLLVIFHNELYIFDLSKMPSRDVGDSNADPESTFGSRDGFVESYKENIAIIRSRLKCNNLNIDEYVIGRRSKTNVLLLSIDDIHNKDILNRIKEKLNKIDVDAILTIDDFIAYFASHLTFPTFQYLGNPDLACRRLYQGEFVIVIDRIPVVLCIPTTISLATRFRVDESSMRLFPILERFILLLALIFSTIFLSVFSSFITFQNDCLSLLVLSILKTSQKSVVVPIAIEILIVLGLFELYHLIGYRQSKTTISSTVVLIGGLIIGQNMMESGIAGVFIITFTALAYLTGFVVSANAQTIFSISIVRICLLLASFIYGFVGLCVALTILGYLAYKDQMFNVAYFHPFIPFDLKDLRNFFVPTSALKNIYRPDVLMVNDKTRRKNEKV